MNWNALVSAEALAARLDEPDLRIVDALPMTAMDKRDRRALADLAGSEPDADVS